MSNSPLRISLYRKIEVGRKQVSHLQDESTFRALLEDKFNKNSRKNMSLPELQKLVDMLSEFGAEFTMRAKKKTDKKPRGSKRKDFLPITDDMPYAKERRQILAIWRKLGYNLSSLDTRVKRAFGCEAFYWLANGEHVKVLLSDLQKREKAFDAKQAGL